MELASPFVYVGPGFNPQSSRQDGEESPYDMGEEVVRRPYRIDTNVLMVSLGYLSVDAPCQSRSHPLTCLICDAAYCSTSAPVRQNAPWVCEYCGQENDPFEGALQTPQLNEIQRVSTVDYHLGGAESQQTGALTLFVMDISGSMCLSTKAENEDRYVSRLEAMQQTVVAQIDLLRQKNPANKIGLITFDDTVTVHGDGTQTSAKIADDSLFEYDRLLDIGQRLNHVRTRIEYCHEKLVSKTQSLHANGQTALGPALVVALGIASREVGSSIILCTDGLSNVGIGALSPESTELERSFANGMFKRASSFAVEMGVCVSVVSIKGEECNLADLGALAEETGGQVHRVEPTQLNEVVTELTSNETIATNVEATLFLHTSQYPFKNAEPDQELAGLSSQRQIAACVSGYSELTFQFGPASVSRIADLPLKPSNPFRMPIQIQIKYTRNGVRRLRVLSEELPITDDWDQSTEQLNLETLTKHAARCSAQLALTGDFGGAWQLAEDYKRFFEQVRHGPRNEVLYDSYAQAIEVFGARRQNAVYRSASAAPPQDARVARNATYDFAAWHPASNANSMQLEDQTVDRLFQMMNIGNHPDPNRAYDCAISFVNPNEQVIDLRNFSADTEHEALYDPSPGENLNAGEPLYATIEPSDTF